MNRIEAVIFASNTVVPRAALQKLIGDSVTLDLLIADIQAELKGRSFELSGGGWMFRTKPHYADGQGVHSAKSNWRSSPPSPAISLSPALPQTRRTTCLLHNA